MKVLVAEDDVTSRRILEAIVTKWGYEAVSACDGNEAWEKLRGADAPRIAILDWVMPGMAGVEVCRKLREAEADDPAYVIVLTSRSDKKDVIEGLSAGANDYIVKPFDNDVLRARIEVGRRVIQLQAALADRVRKIQDALDHVKTLQGILPICMYCHKISNDRKTWERVETYIEKHSDAQFSHGLCPECLEKHYPDVAAESQSGKPEPPPERRD